MVNANEFCIKCRDLWQ